MQRFASTLVALLVLLLGSPVARAQCSGNASSCLLCHEAEGRRPVLAGELLWHRDHAFGDLCASCHGGDPASSDEAVAHAGMVDPLRDAQRACASCHASDHEAKLAVYAGARAARGPTTPLPPRAPPPPTSRASIAVAAFALVLGLVLMVALRRRQLRGSLRRVPWSPYAAGALLGATTALTLMVAHRPLAVSAAFDKLAAYPGRALFPNSPYYAHVMTPGVSFHVWLVLGLFLGALLSALLARTFRLRSLPDRGWSEAFGTRFEVRAVIAFVGAMLVQIGAGIAGGCTSGLAISGGVVMAPGAFVFVGGMFAAGIPVALLVGRRARGGS